jgi:hypothetical protein
MNIIYADIVAAQVVVAAVQEDIYTKSLPLIKKIYDFDGDMSKLAIQLPESIGELGKLWEQASRLEAEIPKLFRGVLDVLKASEDGKSPNHASAADA